MTNGDGSFSAQAKERGDRKTDAVLLYTSLPSHRRHFTCYLQSLLSLTLKHFISQFDIFKVVVHVIIDDVPLF